MLPQYVKTQYLIQGKAHAIKKNTIGTIMFLSIRAYRNPIMIIIRLAKLIDTNRGKYLCT